MTADNRRKLLKTIAAGGGAVVAGKNLPQSWSRPVIDSVVLPSHAATTATFSITAELTNTPNDLCDSDGENFRIDGSVTASNGADLAGVELNLHYTDSPPDGDFVDFVTAIQPGNTYSFSAFAVATVGEWNQPPYQVVVTFVDQATYGDASATVTGACGNLVLGAKIDAY